MADGASEPVRVLVIGGTGVFGERLVAGLLSTTGFHVVVAGRDEARLASFLRRHDRGMDGSPRLVTLRLDARCATPAILRATGAFAVVDAAGPFQGNDYDLPRAAIAAGMHYVDLSDARDFVAGFGALDGAARAAGVVALSGASSTPALSCAALDRLTANWTRVDRVEVAIAPGNRAPRGLSVVRSILSYAGKPVRVFTEGRWRERPGWGMSVRRTFPGLGKRWLSLAETPDLDVIPARYSVRDAAVFRAGLELSVLHLGLLAASLPVRLRLLGSLGSLARPLRWLADVFRPMGVDRGGMTVEADGLDARGRPVRGLWLLVAEGGDGPFVPTLPALAALRALADRRIVQPGASACVGVLSLAQIEAEFRGYGITSSMRFEHPAESLYERVLGADFHRLPEPLRRVHQPGWQQRARGTARVDGPDSWIARLAAATFGFPSSADQLPVSVVITAESARERWVRDFGGRRFASVLSASATTGRLLERFGPFTFELDLVAGDHGVLGMPVRAWRLGLLPLPRMLAPVSIVREHLDEHGRFRFDVELRLPLGLGRLVRYRGWLVPDAPDVFRIENRFEEQAC